MPITSDFDLSPFKLYFELVRKNQVVALVANVFFSMLANASPYILLTPEGGLKSWLLPNW